MWAVRYRRVPSTAWLLIALGGCSAAPDGNGTSGELGDACQFDSDCTVGFCEPLNDNFEGVPGVCSTPCTTSADCASGGVCLNESGASLCWLRCSSSNDCGVGVACIWDEGANSGVCAAVATAVCNQLIGANECTTCVANSCCDAYDACVGDLTCGKDFASCANAACSTAGLESSPDAIESDLGQCMAASCAGLCP